MPALQADNLLISGLALCKNVMIFTGCFTSFMRTEQLQLEKRPEKRVFFCFFRKSAYR